MLDVFNSRTVGGPYHQWGPPSLDAAATPSLCHWTARGSVNGPALTAGGGDVARGGDVIDGV